MIEPNRIVCHFSCGAASAVATKLAIERNNAAPFKVPLVIIYCRVKEEDADNMRFLKDCEAWFGLPVEILGNKKYDGSVVQVMKQRGFINSAKGAPCTLFLKKEPARAFAQCDDMNVYGYTLGEEWRVDNWIDANADAMIRAPLIEAGLDKGACMALVERAGIAMPRLYAMGYDHNNCIGCVKGGAWYWNKIRVDFPERFAEQSAIEQMIGHPTLRINGVGVYLKDLAPDRGRKHEEPKIECGVACELAEQTIYAAGLL